MRPAIGASDADAQDDAELHLRVQLAAKPTAVVEPLFCRQPRWSSAFQTLSCQ